MFIKPLYIAIALALPGFAHAQATTSTAVSQFIGNMFTQVAIERAMGPADPRIQSTMYSLGQKAAGVAAAAGGGLLAAGSAPAWVTVVGSLALGYAVTLAVDKAAAWVFGPNDVTPSGFPATGPVQPGTTAGGSAYVGNIWDSTTNSSKIIYAGDPYTALSGLFRCSGNGTYYCSTATTKYYIKDCVSGSGGASQACQVWEQYVPTNATSYVATYSVSTGTSPSTCSAGNVSLIGAGGCVPAPAIPANPTTTGNNQNGVAVPMTTAVSGLPADVASAPFNYSTMANLINNLWQQAAAQPGYSGLPYDSTRPITASQVQTAAQANPSAYPSVAAVVAPVADPATGFAPAPSGTPVTNPKPETSTNPSTQPQTNLGDNPNIGSPTLEATPTAQQIVGPLLSLLPDFKSYSVPAHQAECPKPAFEVFGQIKVMDQHCTLFEGQRSNLYAACMLAFALVALFIILSA